MLRVEESLFHEKDPLWLTKDPAECPGMRRHGCHLLSGYDIPVKGVKWQKMCGSAAQTRPLSSYVAFRFYTYAFQKKKLQMFNPTAKKCLDIILRSPWVYLILMLAVKHSLSQNILRHPSMPG
jgi:hypothetical protein